MSPERKRKAEKEHFCAVVEGGSGLCKQITYQAGKGTHPLLAEGLIYFCLTKEGYLRGKEIIDQGKIFFFSGASQDPPEPEGVHEPPSGAGPKRAAFSSNPQGYSLSTFQTNTEAPRSQEKIAELRVPPLWTPEGLPPVSFQGFGRELREIDPGPVMLSWEGEPVRLSVNGTELFVRSPLELNFEEPGSYVLTVLGENFQPSSYYIEVRFPLIRPILEKKNV